MYILIAYLLGATAWATTFDSNFQRFETKKGCNDAKQIIISGVKPILEAGGFAVVECVYDGKNGGDKNVT